ncbi:MAG: hypothetical protein LC745_13250, partial [Planctomycetia bacterium]|nr:hypothetical protein [Planctomycetia bacterium]
GRGPAGAGQEDAEGGGGAAVIVFLFKPRFVEPVRTGAKRQTVRRARKWPVRRGDVLGLRRWAGQPYRSPQAEILPPVVCASVAPIRVAVDVFGNRIDVEVGGERLTHDEARAFVRADGFRCVSDFVGYYRSEGVDSFDGVLIQWEYPGVRTNG